MTVQELAALLKKEEIPHGVFLFCGEEDYLIRRYLADLRARVVTDPSLASFNHLIFEGTEIDVGALTDALRTPPMFAPAKLIEWHLPDLNSLREKQMADLALFCEEANNEPSTAVVFLPQPEGFDPGTVKRPSAAFRKLGEMMQIVRFDKSTDSALMNWLKRHYDHEGVAVTPDALRAMLDRCGHGMDVLASETEKIAAYAKANGIAAVTPDVVRLVACSTTESDAFALTNALSNDDPRGAFNALSDMKARRVDPTAVLGQISRQCGDLLAVALLMERGLPPEQVASELGMNEYKTKLYAKTVARQSVARLRRAVTLCAEADLRAKTTYGMDAYVTLESLVATLLAKK